MQVPDAQQYKSERPRYQALDEKFHDRYVHIDPHGVRGIFTACNKFVALNVARLHEAGEFRRPDFIVKNKKRPTGHQPSKGKKDESVGKNNTNSRHKQ